MRFLRLSNRLISQAFIQSVHITPEKYTIYLQATGLDGFVAFGCGFIASNSNIIQIEKEKHATDYEVVSKWINEVHL